MDLAVGFEDVTNDIIGRLSQETDYFDVISVIGMFGSGKTCLAWKIFNDPNIILKFPTRVWLTISQRFKARDMFQSILKQLVSVNDENLGKADDELVQIVYAYLERGSFLIIMDDVWETADWDRLQEALPKRNTKGKVLISSRNKEVGRYASGERPLYNLRLFTFEESWELLLLMALGNLECPSELEVFGRAIAESCDGLPLAITCIGMILGSRSSTDLNETRHLWEKVSQDMISYLSVVDSVTRSISLSYEGLPYDMRPCFLYFGLFPRGYEIRVSKLIHMWIAEGFIEQESERTLEETAESYLEDLINRNLVESCKVGPDGSVKTCQIHVTVHYFCQTEGANVIFLHEIKLMSNGEFAYPISNNGFRLLALNYTCLDFISSRRSTASHAHSFVCFSNDDYVGSLENNIVGFFKSIKVLDVQSFKSSKIDNDIYNLIHLKYLALSSVLTVLPSKFNQFWNIQTLIIETSCHTLKVEADIWKMKQLRHFMTNASATLNASTTLPKSTESGKYSSELQTLEYISVESCTEALFRRTSKLKKLGIRGKLVSLFEGRSGSLDGLRNISLQKLKLVNDTYPKPGREGIGHFPTHNQFPYDLTSLTLSGTFLSWKHMSTLGSLEELKVLKLKDNAFTGRIWEADGATFNRLLLLHIEDTNLVVWKASSHNYPKLISLVLKCCEKLHIIPPALAEIPSLQKLELYNCISAAKSAKDISDAKKMTIADQGSAFMLSIFPPIH